MSARLKEKYVKEVAPRLMKEREYPNVMAVPKLKKIVINMGVGEATQNIKVLDVAAEELGRIAGQKPAVKRSKLVFSSQLLRLGRLVSGPPEAH